MTLASGWQEREKEREREREGEGEGEGERESYQFVSVFGGFWLTKQQRARKD